VTLMHVFICEIFINRYTKLQDGSLNPTKWQKEFLYFLFQHLDCLFMIKRDGLKWSV
jgi:hypothetical protein